MAFCSSCGAQIPAGATACPACSQSAGTTATATATATQTAGSGLTDNVAGMLAYVTIIPAIIFLVMEPYNKNKFIRFHSFQCIFVGIVFFVLGVGLSILSVIPFLGLITVPLGVLLLIGGLVLWLILLLKANQGQMFKLPVIGDMAEKQAAAIS